MKKLFLVAALMGFGTSLSFAQSNEAAPLEKATPAPVEKMQPAKENSDLAKPAVAPQAPVKAKTTVTPAPAKPVAPKAAVTPAKPGDPKAATKTPVPAGKPEKKELKKDDALNDKIEGGLE